MKTAHAFASVAEIPAAIRPEFASMAVVYVPGSLREHAANDAAAEIKAWARHAARANGFGAPETVESAETPPEEARPREPLFATFRRLAASWAR